MIEIGDEKFKQAREKAEALYKSLGEIWCPYFKQKIVNNP